MGAYRGVKLLEHGVVVKSTAEDITPHIRQFTICIAAVKQKTDAYSHILPIENCTANDCTVADVIGQ